VIGDKALQTKDLKNKKKVLIITIILNLIIVVSQIIAGIYSHSIALITDAVHNLQDVISLIIAYIAIIFMAKKPTPKMTFGYKRAESIAGFVNSAVLIGAIILIIITGIERLIFPQPVESIVVIVVGAIAFIVNSVSAYLLGFHSHSHHHHHKDEDLNVKAAYLHLFSDALISLGVVIGGVVMYVSSIYWLDPVLSILFSIYILKETIPVFKKSLRILMEGVPEEFNHSLIINEIKSLPNVVDVHDIHIWALSSKDIYFTGHIVVENKEISKLETIIKQLEKKLLPFGVNHITVQFETKNFKCEVKH
jgi:cobalt-zinc-cadmium efflux system protein